MNGHYLLGHDKKHFDLFKTFCQTYENELFDVLGDQYIMYGEWMYALHSIYYDKLPSYFMEFDIYDKYNNYFLSTPKRQELISKINNIKIYSVPVLTNGSFDKPNVIVDLINTSLYISPNAYECLGNKMISKRYPQHVQDSILKLNKTRLSEGLYIKIENDEQTIGRFKFVRADFTQTILENDLHWNDRPIINNELEVI